MLLLKQYTSASLGKNIRNTEDSYIIIIDGQRTLSQSGGKLSRNKLEIRNWFSMVFLFHGYFYSPAIRYFLGVAGGVGRVFALCDILDLLLM